MGYVNILNYSLWFWNRRVLKLDKKYRIGVDLGGTNVKVALVDDKGHIVYL